MNIRNINIGKRLNLGFGLILVLTALMGIAMLIQTQYLWHNINQLYNHPYKTSNLSREIKANLFDYHQEILTHVVFQKDFNAKDLEKLKKLEIEIETNISVINDVYLGKKEDITPVSSGYLRFKYLENKIIEKIRTRDWKSADSLIYHEAIPMVKETSENTQKLVNFAQNRAILFYSNSSSLKSSTTWTTIISLIISIVLGGFIAVKIANSINKPLFLLQETTRRIAQGDLKQKIKVDGNDEISELLTVYKTMQENLLQKADVAAKIANGELHLNVEVFDKNDELAISINKIINNLNLITDQAERIAKGDFSATIPIRSENDKLATTIYYMVASLREVLTQSTMIASGDYSGMLEPKSEFDELAKAINKMTQSLREITTENTNQSWLQRGLNELHEKMRGEQDVPTLSANIVTFLCNYLKAPIGAIYLHNKDDNTYSLKGSYAYTFRKGVKNNFLVGEGLIGQAALEQKVLVFSNLPDNYMHINSGLGNSLPRTVVVAPFVFQGITIGVIEIACLTEFTPIEFLFLEHLLDQVAISFNMAINRAEMKRLLAFTQEQAEMLRVKQEEMTQTNEELELQTKALKRSEESLQAQQEELRVINEELQANGQNLLIQQEKLMEKNLELEKAQKEIEFKASELERTSKYKSEFMANMSHELRTPLNSLLILSQDLTQNRDGNLTAEQIESSQIIYKSGNDLLNLINEILDLSKIESGKLEISITKTEVTDITESIRKYFKKQMEEKGLAFNIETAKNAATAITTDSRRLEQILKNLMSNAIKFTEKGSISIALESPVTGTELPTGLDVSQCIKFSVTDTGIGITPEMQLKVFDAFHQGDGSISRRFGGTGLGLSISRELAHLLGGEIYLSSEIGRGSTFSLVLPLQYQGGGGTKPVMAKREKAVEENTQEHAIPMPQISVADDRENLNLNDSSILVIEDDPLFAKILIDQCHRKGFTCLATPTGEEGLKLAEQYNPAAIILDIKLPGMDGWSVMEALKSNSKTRHIPVHMMSAMEPDMEAFRKGAIGYLTKPVQSADLELAFSEIHKFIERKMKELLIIEDDENLRLAIRKIVGSTDIKIKEASTAAQAISEIKDNKFDCIVLDLGLPDMTGFELLKHLEKENIKIPPVIVYTGRDLSQDENEVLQQYANSIIIKGVKSEERLLDETALFLHRVIDELPNKQKSMIINLYDKDKIFRDKKVLVVDDDMRNVFALTKVLEQSGMKVIKADNGAKALTLLDANPDTNLVLMDIMMPVMDGFEATKKIRSQPRFQKLPIIALTAKAMKEDSVKCIAAGANDYMAKPVNVEKLFNLMRVWLY